MLFFIFAEKFYQKVSLNFAIFAFFCIVQSRACIDGCPEQILSYGIIKRKENGNGKWEEDWLCDFRFVKPWRTYGIWNKKRMDTTLKYFSSASYRSIYPALSDLMELQAKKEKAQGELNSILKILIVTFSSFFVLNIVLNYFFPEINFNNLLGRTIYRHRARRIGSVMTVICRFLTSIKVSCLHLGQYSG